MSSEPSLQNPSHQTPSAAIPVPNSDQQQRPSASPVSHASLPSGTIPQSSLSNGDAQVFAPAPIPTSMGSGSSSSPVANMATSSTPLGTISAARRPPNAPTLTSRGSGLNLPQDIRARMEALRLGRQGAPPGGSRMNSSHSDGVLSSNGSGLASPSNGSPQVGAFIGGVSTNFKMVNGKPVAQSIHSSPAVVGRLPPKKPSLADKRGMVLQGGLSAATGGPQTGVAPAGRKRPGLTLSSMAGGSGTPATDETKPTGGTLMDKYSQFLDAKAGTLKFAGKAVLSSDGVEFASGSSFSISLNEVDTIDELGKGNYGTVYKVRHARPRVRRPGMGLAGNKNTSYGSNRSSDASPEDIHSPAASFRQSGTSGAIMAMKEIRLELDDAKFAAIIMELDILHRCVSLYIIDFYGAFFQEGAVYICMEFMDGGSIDKLYGDGIPESVLRKIAYCTTMGLKALKEEHNIIHRDVKPTNILMNTKGQIKICDFGVSGNLVASIAKTNIGCQSYMAPERISSGGVAMAGAPGGTYSVQSDIWSLGLTIIECALGRYPYPPETYNNIFSQLSAIVDGDPPDLPKEGYSDAARNFVSGCLNKIPKLRPTYAMLLQHAWLAPLAKPDIIAEEDEEEQEITVVVTDSSDPTPDTSGSSNEITPDDTETVSLVVEENIGSTPLKLQPDVVDREVAEWVLEAIERRKSGKMGHSAAPALHKAPLDVVSTPEAAKAPVQRTESAPPA